MDNNLIKSNILIGYRKMNYYKPFSSTLFCHCDLCLSILPKLMEVNLKKGPDPSKLHVLMLISKI